MRLHRLAITAFGPFAETVDVDFDAALRRRSVPALGRHRRRQDQRPRRRLLRALRRRARRPQPRRAGCAPTRPPPGLAPLRRARRHAVRAPLPRSSAPPPGTDPRSAAPALTREQAKVTVSERSDGAWVPLEQPARRGRRPASRGLLGMNLDQFCQVAMLPQGHFQAFLRADSDAAPPAAARLFRTGRFERVEALAARPPAGPAPRVADPPERGRRPGQPGRPRRPTSRPPEDARRPVGRGRRRLAAVPGRPTSLGADGRARAAAADARARPHAGGRAHDAVASAWERARDEAARARRACATPRPPATGSTAAADDHAADVARLEAGRRAEGLRPLARLVDDRAVQRRRGRRRAQAALARGRGRSAWTSARPARRARPD